MPRTIAIRQQKQWYGWPKNNGKYGPMESIVQKHWKVDPKGKSKVNSGRMGQGCKQERLMEKGKPPSYAAIF